MPAQRRRRRRQTGEQADDARHWNTARDRHSYERSGPRNSAWNARERPRPLRIGNTTEHLRILHTADWHLGQTLHGVPRTYEHARFLDWLLETIERETSDALIIAGDVFDAA